MDPYLIVTSQEVLSLSMLLKVNNRQKICHYVMLDTCLLCLLLYYVKILHLMPASSVALAEPSMCDFLFLLPNTAN